MTALYSWFIFFYPLLIVTYVNGITSKSNILPQQRIINGIPVDIKNYNYYVYLDDGNTFCGGALVHVNKIITAAHCGVTWHPPLYAYPGVNNLKEIDSGRRYISYRWYKHDQFKEDTLENDLCVVVLTENVILNDRIGLISIARHPPPVNSSITIVGHGSTDCSRVVNDTCVNAVSFPLMKTDMVISGYQGSMIVIPMTPNRPCKVCIFGGYFFLGDSGGPWTYRGQLVAVVSHSEGLWCNGNFEYETATMITPIPQFLARFGIYPK